ncbi:lipopolysaccharide-induced tumor necrosis factor-alpha factor homolog [Aricia agestis]|uniref:lipopolysaccharide-induced tumor necrosis factor-alpha factor homolog n=1 Tax=Aricia agestis TaxID=91739 RepID=UPI001C209992|nr:lipopolysaccharide-induced tumor necrosis factor-alpha factor homolog [Aricia agestis]
MNQPQMYQSGAGMTSVGSVGVVTGQPGVVTSVGMVGQTGGMASVGMVDHTGGMGQVGMVTGQPGTMSVVAPGFVVLNQMVYQPTPYTCRSCHQQIVTKVKRKPTFKTHFFAAGFCLVCWIPCAIIPYCMDGCRQADHYCPNCDSFIGSYVP